MGGLTIESTATAKVIAAFPEMEGETLRVGRSVRLDPCMPAPILAAFEAKEGRPCPRVELQPGNVEASQLFAIITCEDTRPLAQRWMDHNLAGLTEEEAGLVVNRTIAARMSEKVAALYRPTDDEPGKEN